MYPDAYWEYYVCAKEFGWTTEQVDNAPADKLAWIMAIHSAVVEVENEGK